MKSRSVLASSAGALIACALASVGCGSRTSAQNPPMTPAAATTVPKVKPPRALRPHANDDDDNGADGVLVVSKEIVQACGELQAVRREASHIDPDEVWLVVLEGLADCMTDGSLRARRVRVTGNEEGRDIVRKVLSAHGVPLSRVTYVHRTSTNGRVDITLLPAEGTDTTL